MRRVFFAWPSLPDLGDLLVGHVEEFEFGQRAGLERLGAGPGQIGGLIERQQVLDLGAVKLRRINIEERVAAMDLLAGGIDVELLNPALELGGDIRERGFVEVHHAHRSHDSPQRAARHQPGAQVHVLHRDRVNRD